LADRCRRGVPHRQRRAGELAPPDGRAGRSRPAATRDVAFETSDRSVAAAAGPLDHPEG